MLRRAWRRRHSISPSFGLSPVSADAAVARAVRPRGTRARRPRQPANRGRHDRRRRRVPRPGRRGEAQSRGRAGARQHLDGLSARRAKPGHVRPTRDTDRATSERSAKCPRRSVTPNTVLDTGRRDDRARHRRRRLRPGRDLRSFRTAATPDAADAAERVCARTGSGAHREPPEPRPRAAINLDACLMVPPGGRGARRRVTRR